MATLEIDIPAPSVFSTKTTKDGGSSIGARILRSRSHIERKAADIKLGKVKSSNFKELTEKEITKLYTNNKLSRVKVTALETIFEHEEEYETNDSGNCSSNSSECSLSLPNKSDPTQIFGKRKVKRAVLFSESMKPTKTLREKRKKRVLAMLGNRKRFKHMSMRSFLERFEANDTITFDMTKSNDVLSAIKIPL